MDIILKPVVTEKMNLKGETLRQYGFVVDKRANKVQIKKAVEALYGVTVESVNTMRYAGKYKSRYTKTGLITGRKNSTKKAVVTLRKGETIDFYSNI
ncbi:MAG: 50S ribosomal protein L23 [Bacteroidales bacterium]|nr:50S ribosomal protein L23 [Bacteroidales bacterium]MBN2763160.1 50S ribosomal protein L23 [Bacteroidales bacterium]